MYVVEYHTYMRPVFVGPGKSSQSHDRDIRCRAHCVFTVCAYDDLGPDGATVTHTNATRTFQALLMVTRTMPQNISPTVLAQ